MTFPTTHPETKRAKKREGGKLDGSMGLWGKGVGVAKEAGRVWVRKYAAKKRVCNNETVINCQIERDGVVGTVLFGVNICHLLVLGWCPSTRASPHPDLQEIWAPAGNQGAAEMRERDLNRPSSLIIWTPNKGFLEAGRHLRPTPARAQGRDLAIADSAGTATSAKARGISGPAPRTS